jgi:PAS domain S-box-containing protein
VYTVVVVDDAADVRFLVKTQLKLSERFEVVGEGADGREAVSLAEELQPDMILLDVSMPGMDGLEALPRIREVAPTSKVVMYTGFDEQGLADRALLLGATALIEKSTSLDDLGRQLLDLLGADPTPIVLESQAASEGVRVLGEHLERFREVFDEAAIGMATMTLAGRVVRANKALAALVGRGLAELVALPYTDLTTEPHRALTSAALAAARDEPVRFEHMVDLPTGGRRVLATAAPVKDSQGRALYLFVQVQDVTGQRSAEEALRQVEERFRLLVDAVQDYAIFMLDPDGHVTSWNRGAERINGYAADEILGQHFRVFYPRDKQQERHPEHELELALRDGHYEEEGWRIRKDGTRLWASVVITAVHDAQGRHVGFAKVTRDMTERRQMMLDREQAAAALAATNAELEAANRRLAGEAADQAQFLAVTAHELRNPVSVLTGSAGLLARHWADMSDDERMEMLGSISSSSDRLQRMVSDLLTVSRLEAKAVRLQTDVVPLEPVLSQAVARFRASQPGAHITVDCPSDLMVRADRDRLGQAIDNLVANALRHGEPPVSVVGRDRDGRIEIRVQDSGPGVSPGMRNRLFQRFAAGGPGKGGTGLGLFIVRELARAHGGDASYVPTPEGGAAFAITLPYPDEPVPAA